jgi:hypothetical protein
MCLSCDNIASNRGIDLKHSLYTKPGNENVTEKSPSHNNFTKLGDVPYYYMNGINVTTANGSDINRTIFTFKKTKETLF